MTCREEGQNAEMSGTSDKLDNGDESERMNLISARYGIASTRPHCGERVESIVYVVQGPAELRPDDFREPPGALRARRNFPWGETAVCWSKIPTCREWCGGRGRENPLATRLESSSCYYRGYLSTSKIRPHDPKPLILYPTCFRITI